MTTLPPPPPSARRESSRTLLYVLVGVVVAVVLAVGLVAVFLAGDDDDDAIDGGADVTADADDDGSGDGSGLPPELVDVLGQITIEGDALPPLGEGDDPAIGVRPPTLVGEDVSGAEVTISPDEDGPVMLVFLAHWCPACNAEVPHLVELAADGRLPDELEVYGVLTGMAPDRPNFPPAPWLESFGWPFSAVADGVDLDRQVWVAADAYGLTSYPYVVVWDDGVVVDRWGGGLGADALAARIAAALG